MSTVETPAIATLPEATEPQVEQTETAAPVSAAKPASKTSKKPASKKAAPASKAKPVSKTTTKPASKTKASTSKPAAEHPSWKDMIKVCLFPRVGWILLTRVVGMHCREQG